MPSALLFGTPIAFGGRQFCVALAAISACFVIYLWPEIGLAAWPSCADLFIPTHYSHLHPTSTLPALPTSVVPPVHDAQLRMLSTYNVVFASLRGYAQRSALLLQLFLLAHVAIGKADAVSALDDAEALDVMGGCRCCH